MRVIWMLHPDRPAIIAALRVSTFKVPLPTVPSPQIPTLTCFKLSPLMTMAADYEEFRKNSIPIRSLWNKTRHWLIA
jgi:hypothetical protein